MFEKLSERFTRIFERLAPVVSCDVEAIATSAPPGFVDGYFIVKNTGGGNLEGDIFAKSSYINLLTQTVEGNDVIIEYEIDLNHLNPGDVFESQIVLTTSGGQFLIPVTITIEPYRIMCGEYNVYSLKDFYDCARVMPNEAAAVFVTDEFERWLIDSKCKHMELYRTLKEKGAGIKGIDCFLTVCGLKSKAYITAAKENVEVRVSLNEAVTTGFIELISSEWGFFEYGVKTASNAPWLILSSETVNSGDFNKNRFKFPFSIDRKQLKEGKSFETVVFENSHETVCIKIAVLLPKLFTVKPSRLSYKNEDSGYLACNNHTGKNALVEVSTSEKFVRFKAEKYVVEKTAEIPFDIKVNSFLNLGIGKRPISTSNVNVRAVIDGKVYKETITVKAGSLLNI